MHFSISLGVLKVMVATTEKIASIFKWKFLVIKLKFSSKLRFVI